MSRIDTIETRALRLPPHLVDAVLSLALALATVVTVTTEPHPSALTAISGLVAAAAVAFRRRAPALAVVAADVAAGNLIFGPVAIALTYYALGRHPQVRRRFRATTVRPPWVDAALLAAPIVAITLDPNTPSAGDPLVVSVLSVWAFFMAIPFAAGRVVGTRTALNAELDARVQQLESEQRERARRAIAEERTRIARELHDVVAHSVSVMVIQTGAARRVAGHDPARAAEALRSVETCGRDALVDMRRMIGALHRDDRELLGGAAPGLSQLAKLVERACVSGLPTTLSIEGDPRALSPALDLVLFRVVQEALTNAIKHAGPAQAAVRLTFTSQSLDVEITDTGSSRPPGPTSPRSPGHGLVGMQERLTLYGGQLRAGHQPDGFQVLARIPLDEKAMA